MSDRYDWDRIDRIMTDRLIREIEDAERKSDALAQGYHGDEPYAPDPAFERADDPFVEAPYRNPGVDDDEDDE
jgi:hypothetical protein